MMTFVFIFISLPGTFLLALIIQELITKKWLSGEYLRRSVFLIRFLTLQGIALGLCIQKTSPWLYLVLIVSAFSLFWMFARFREQDKGSNPIRCTQQTKKIFTVPAAQGAGVTGNGVAKQGENEDA